MQRLMIVYTTPDEDLTTQWDGTRSALSRSARCRAGSAAEIVTITLDLLPFHPKIKKKQCLHDARGEEGKNRDAHRDD